MDNQQYCTTIPKLRDISAAAARKRKAERQRLYTLTQNHSGEASKYYSTTAWRNVRQAYLIEHPICELSLLEHKVVEAEQVHHLVKWFDQATDELRWRLLLDPENLISLTNSVHQLLHYSREGLTEKQRKEIEIRKQRVVDKYISQGI